MRAVRRAARLFHRLRCGPRLRSLLCRIDHSAIFIFIAASYTPVTLLVLDGPIGWTLFAAVWAGALVGVTLSMAWISAPRVLFAGTYVALGWIAIAGDARAGLAAAGSRR